MVDTCAGMALRFFGVLFPEDAWLHFRAVPEPASKERKPTNHWYQMGVKSWEESLEGFLTYCANENRAAFFLPAVANPGMSHKNAVKAMTCIAVDFDKGNPAANLAAAEAFIDVPADIVVRSGGMTDAGPKLHAYWLLGSLPAQETADICFIREKLAQKFGGDPCLKQEAQVLRIPGSIHFKNEPKLVELIRCP